MEIEHLPQLDLSPGWMNAAGFTGFAPGVKGLLSRPPIAFVTNPISFRPRSPSSSRNCLPVPGGLLLHTGWPNPGFRKVVEQYGERWARADMPIWVHLLAEQPAQLDQMVRELEDLDGVAAIELGFAPRVDDPGILTLVEAALGELPIVVCVPVDQARAGWVKSAVDIGVNGICLSAPRGLIPCPKGGLLRGRIYGPSLFPQVLNAVNSLEGMKLPIIAGCGVFDDLALDLLLEVGATAVQIDAALWRGWETMPPS